jgi:hypothetical protein
MAAHGRREADPLFAIVKDGVVRSKEDVTEDPEGACWHIKAHEATHALLLVAGAHLHTQSNCGKAAHSHAGDRAPLARCSLHNTTILSEAPIMVWAQLHWPGPTATCGCPGLGQLRTEIVHGSTMHRAMLHLQPSVGETVFRLAVLPRAKAVSFEPVRSTVGSTLWQGSTQSMGGLDPYVPIPSSEACCQCSARADFDDIWFCACFRAHSDRIDSMQVMAAWPGNTLLDSSLG